MPSADYTRARRELAKADPFRAALGPVARSP